MRSPFLPLVAAVLVAACSGSSSPGVPSPGTTATNVSPTSPTPYTLDDVCERTAAAVCGIEKPCCEIGGGYDEAGCIAHAKAECANDVAEARAGHETFHPERIDPCVGELPKMLRTCTFSYAVLYEVVPKLAGCRIFEGSLPEGAACTRDAQCAPASGTDAVASCDTTTRVCKTTRLLAQGETCVLADGVSAICGAGLYCDVDFATKPLTGTCKPATPIGARCGSAKPIDLSCGLGNYCDASTRVCTEAKAAGAPCAQDLECASFKCGGSACTAPKPLVTREVCTGP